MMYCSKHYQLVRATQGPVCSGQENSKWFWTKMQVNCSGLSRWSALWVKGGRAALTVIEPVSRAKSAGGGGGTGGLCPPQP